MQMGLKSFLIADSLIGVVAQRLVRKICPYCKTKVNPPKKLLEKIKNYLPENPIFYGGKGCPKCSFTGYLGRTMISEILVIDEEISNLISQNATKFEILNYALKSNDFKPMIVDGIKKVLNGVTTVEEILRVTKEKS